MVAEGDGVSRARMHFGTMQAGKRDEVKRKSYRVA
jgi:hypothetical protein